MCVWWVKFKLKNMGSLRILYPKIWGSCISPTQNMGDNFDGKELFLRYYKNEFRKKRQSLENFYPQKWEVHVANFRPKKWLSSEISDPRT